MAGNTYTLFYWLTSKKVTELDLENDIGYGVEIAKCKEGKTIERERAEIVSFHKEKVIAWIRNLAAGAVTPMSLLALTDDFVSEQGFEV